MIRSTKTQFCDSCENMFFVSLFKSICQTADKKQKEGEGEKKNETCSSLSKEAISIRQFLATELKVGFYFFYFFLWTWKEEVEIAITISCMNIFLTYESSDLPCAAGAVSLIPEVVITL